MRRTVPKLATAAVAVAIVLIALSARGRLGLASGEAEASGTLPPPAVTRGLSDAAAERVAVFAGGCFWGVEAVFEHLAGVSSAVSGFAGGGTGATPSYNDVSSGRATHAEAVRVTYDPSRITYAQLLRVFFSVAHDPTQLNRQGPDVGPQYRSAIFFGDPDEQREAEAYMAQLTEAKAFVRPIVTQLTPLDQFHEAAAYHQNYLVRNPTQPYIVINDLPKLEGLRSQFPELYREPAVN
jgi:peptide-methionine (S)-S-oxide reductase